MKARRILFVCTGNTCRSPMAEAIARVEAAARADAGRAAGTPSFASAGTFAAAGAPASEGALRAAARHGVDLSSHSSRPLTPEALAEADLLVAMTPSHLDAAATLFPAFRGLLATDLLPADDPRHGAPVPDPFGGPDAAYDDAWQVLSDCVAALLDRLEGAGDAE